MADLLNGLRITFGLRNNPSASDAQKWVSQTIALVASGIEMDLAGRAAARQLFPDFGKVIYASEGDTIEALLAAARERAQRGG